MKCFYTVILLFSCSLLSAQIFPVIQIENNGPDAERVNYVVLGDGYTAGQQATFITDATQIANDFFNKTPFKEYRNFFNVYAIEVPSVQSGADHPGTATDVPEPAHPVSAVNTYFGTTFDYANIHRLLVPTNSAAIYAVVGANYPNYDQIIVLSNTPHYGGSGGVFATNSLHASASELAIHEVGHSFGGLADEYWSGATSERPNRTSQSNPALVKWASWVGSNSIGVYPYGSSGTAANYFRPHQNCEMRFLNREFCAVCAETLIDRVYALVDPIDSYLPTSNNLNFTGTALDFSLNLVLPNPNTLKIEWLLNGVSFANDVSSISLNAGDLPSVDNALIVNITDTTLLSKSYLPASGYVFSLNWTINNAVLPIDLIDFQARAKERYVTLDWSTNAEINIEKYSIERSSDALSFEQIAELPIYENTKNLQRHTIIDSYPLEGKSYYRLKTIEKNGNFEYSSIRAVNRVQKFFFKLYPNPSQNQIFLDYYTNSFEADFSIELYNALGQQLKTIKADGSKGNHVLIIDISKYPAGNYFLQINKKNYTRKFEFVKIGE